MGKSDILFLVGIINLLVIIWWATFKYLLSLIRWPSFFMASLNGNITSTAGKIDRNILVLRARAY
jgi:hypothetical protein